MMATPFTNLMAGRPVLELLQVLEGIALLKKFPHPKFLTCIVSEVNRTEVQAVVRFAREQGFLPVVGAYHWNVGTHGRPDALLMYDRSSAAAVFSGLLDDELIPPGYLRKFVEDNVSWLRGQKLEPCDAGWYSIAIDASGNVSRGVIKTCSDHSSCNRLDGRVVGTILRHPIDRGAGVISVVMPAYNEERALPNTLRALFSQFGDYEVVVVDGGSTDRTHAIVESFGFIDSASAPPSFVRYITRYVSPFTL